MCFRLGPVWGCDRLLSNAKVIENQVPVALEVGAAVVASPAGVLELDTHSSSEADPLESSPPLGSVAPIVSPFLCSDDSESDTKILERHVSPTPHDAMLTRWRIRVASRSSSPTTSTPEIPTASILPALSAIVAPSSEFPLAPDIPIGRLYRTHPGSPCRALTARKSVRPLPSHLLALRRASPDTIIADSSTPPRFVYPPLAKTPRCSEAYLRWSSAPLSTMSHVAFVTSFIHATRDLVLSRADLFPLRKRFRDFIPPKDMVEEDIDKNVLKDIEADTTAIEVVVDRDVVTGVDAGIDMEVNVGVNVEDEVEDEVESSDRGTIEVGVDVVVGIDILDGMLIPDAVEHLEQVEEDLQDVYEHVMEIPLQRIEDIETG
ncbi:hypothetical protein Tco_0784509 [Tanacetum coccineum]